VDLSKALRTAALLLALIAAPAAAQQSQPANGLLLVAKPTLSDPNFARTVVLVTQTEDGGTVGVILNRPTELKLSQFLTNEFNTENYRDRIYVGGPVMQQVLIVVFRSEKPPVGPAFHVLKDVYLSLHPQNLRALLGGSGKRYRLYAGFSGWAPRQLQSEMQRDGWYVLPADVDMIFRDNMEGVWQELVNRAEKRPIVWQGEPALAK